MAVIPNLKQLCAEVANLRGRAHDLFLKKTNLSAKSEVNIKNLRKGAIGFALIFIAIVMLMPEDRPVEFTDKIVPNSSEEQSHEARPTESSGAAQSLWSLPRETMRAGGRGSDPLVNHNTSMVLGAKTGNAKVQLRSGFKLPLRIMDKFIVSDEPVPILAELLLDVVTESGLRLPAGSRFYGEASFQKGRERAIVQFRQVSLTSGAIRSLTGIGVGMDGQPGLGGRVYSDGLKNTAGSVLTTFVGGLAAGSIETDFMGHSKGGLANGLLSAVAATAKERAQGYGEKMKAEREWIEVPAGTECDLLLGEVMNLQQGFFE